MINKKGAELSLNFIIIAAIVLVVLIVAVLFFTGASGKLLKEKAEVTKLSTQEYALALNVCKFACLNQDRVKFDNPSFSQAVIDAGLTKCENFDELDTFENECQKECVNKPDVTLPEGTRAVSCSGMSKEDCETNSVQCSWE